MSRTTRLLVLLTAVGLAVTGAACSGEDRASAEGPGDDATARTGEAAVRLATAEFNVEGMTCGGCALATEMSVKKLEGVASADAEYDEATDEGRCTVEYDPSVVSTDRIAAAIRDAGFTPTLTGTAGGD